MRVALILVKKLSNLLTALSSPSHDRETTSTRAQTETEGVGVSSRFGIAAQALGVAALGAIVYFAFLAPSDPDPLSGIEVDGNLPADVTPGNETATGGRNRQAGPRRRVVRSGGLATIRLVPVTPGAPAASTSTPPSLAENETPVGEQYESQVARILARAARDEP
jgi:hypothetical protein